MTELKIMTLNLKNTGRISEFKRRAGSISALVRWHDPDLIGVQELTEEMIGLLPELSEKYTFYGKARESLRPTNERVCVLFRKDRFRFVNGETFWLSETPEKPGSSMPFSVFPRIMTWAKLEDLESGHCFTFANTHLDHILPGTRLKQVDVICRRMKEHTDESFLIMTGDFNTSNLSLAIHRLIEDPDLSLKDTVPTDGISTMRIFMQAGSSQFRPIDHIFVSRSLEVLKSEIITGMYMGRFPSDHCPILTVISLPEKEKPQEPEENAA